MLRSSKAQLQKLTQENEQLKKENIDLKQKLSQVQEYVGSLNTSPSIIETLKNFCSIQPPSFNKMQTTAACFLIFMVSFGFLFNLLVTVQFSVNDGFSTGRVLLSEDEGWSMSKYVHQTLSILSSPLSWMSWNEPITASASKQQQQQQQQIECNLLKNESLSISPPSSCSSLVQNVSAL